MHGVRLPGAGEYWSPATTLNVQVDENGNLEGTYYAAVSALQTISDGLLNRDRLPKYGLQKGSHTLTPISWGAKLKSVEFQGSGNAKVRIDAGGEYPTPEWADNSTPLDGDADDDGDTKNPICYQKATKPEAAVTLVLTSANHPGVVVHIRGVGPDGLGFPDTEGTVSNGVASAVVTAGTSLPNECKRYDPLSITWYARIDGGAWQQVGTSQNECFVTLVKPPDDSHYSSRFRTVLYLATKEGGATESACLNGTWQAFAGHSVCKWNGTAKAYNQMLYYYRTYDGPRMTAFDLLGSSDGDGNCHAWAELLDLCLKANGIPSNLVLVEPPVKPTTPPNAVLEFGVKNIDFDDANPTWPIAQWDYLVSPPYRPTAWQAWVYSENDLDITKEGVPGEHMGTPKAKLFVLHYIVKATSATPPYYDPSYGISATDAAAYTDMAVAAWTEWIEHDREPIPYTYEHWRQRTASDPDSLVFTDL